jgi:hypothetical protein
MATFEFSERIEHVFILMIEAKRTDVADRRGLMHVGTVLPIGRGLMSARSRVDAWHAIPIVSEGFRPV